MKDQTLRNSSTSKPLDTSKRNKYGFPSAEIKEKPRDRFLEAEIRRRELVDEMRENELNKYWDKFRGHSF